MSPHLYLEHGRPAPREHDEGIFAAIYADAARELGRSEDELRRMAIQVFASMLSHMIDERGSVIWTAAKAEEGDKSRFSVEANIVPRYRKQRP